MDLILQISTTPSLFSVKDIKYEDKSANADIIAQFPCCEQPVENITVNFDENVRFPLFVQSSPNVQYLIFCAFYILSLEWSNPP